MRKRTLRELFLPTGAEQGLTLIDSQRYPSGLVQMTYRPAPAV